MRVMFPQWIYSRHGSAEELEQRLVELTRMLASARLHSKARLEQVRGLRGLDAVVEVRKAFLNVSDGFLILWIMMKHDSLNNIEHI